MYYCLLTFVPVFDELRQQNTGMTITSKRKSHYCTHQIANTETECKKTKNYMLRLCTQHAFFLLF